MNEHETTRYTVLISVMRQDLEDGVIVNEDCSGPSCYLASHDNPEAAERDFRTLEAIPETIEALRGLLAGLDGSLMGHDFDRRIVSATAILARIDGEGGTSS